MSELEMLERLLVGVECLLVVGVGNLLLTWMAIACITKPPPPEGR